eukprot:Pompholyxophrys_punicea_v1_NODE_233_length_2631_cov_11.916149.p1 type:complete len:493 gc:universal NODE_233_length_2631_cov_11.916149:347-1825(+)
MTEFIAEKDSQKLKHQPISVIRAKLATHVVQIFLTSTDGITCLPLGFLRSSGINGVKMAQLVKHWSNILSSNVNAPVELLWGSTDGFKSNHEFVEKMKKFDSRYLHFFDYVHILKNVRNTICNHFVKSPDCPDGFHMTDLVNLREQRQDIYRLLPKEPNPKDKMEMKNVEQLLTREFLDVLEKESSPSLKGLHVYLSHMALFFNIFDDNNLSWKCKQANILKVKDYFTNIQNYTKQFRLGNNLYFQIMTTLHSLETIWSFIGFENVMTSCLGTNVCENFFSLVRRKVRYPSLWDYGCYYARAKMEHVKLNADDNLNRSPKRHVSKKYNNQKNLHYTMKSIKLLSKADRNILRQEIKSNYGGSADDKLFCQEMVLTMRPTRKKLLVREATCKEDPTHKVKVAVRPALICTQPNCSKQYVYPKALITHFITTHNYKEDDAKHAVLAIEAKGNFIQIQNIIDHPLRVSNLLDENKNEEEFDTCQCSVHLYILDRN